MRCHYGQHDTLPTGPIEVTQVTGDVADLAGVTNVKLTQTFTFELSAPQDVSNRVQVQYFGAQVNTRTQVITFQGVATNTSTQPLSESVTF